MVPASPTTRPGSSSALSVLKILDDLKFKDYARITLLLNTNEETGSRGIAGADREARQGA